MNESELFLPEDTNERGGRTVTLDVFNAEITEVNEAKATVKIYGVATDYNDPDKGAVVWLELMGNQVKIPRALRNVRIVFEEE